MSARVTRLRVATPAHTRRDRRQHRSFNVAVPEDVATQLDALAVAEDRSIANLMLRLVREALLARGVRS